ncbi:MAG TPA: outer membrane beta-barrel protein, partial [Polyangiaceae bacterium]|nr:outer membrane beta-barrel protein [Polyangiaceae bacterium]
MRARTIGIGAALAAMFFATASAHAEPKTANSLQLGLGLRYGFEMNDGDFNPWGLGLGIEGGYTLPNAVYVGGLFEYFFGDSQELAGIKVKGNLWQAMAEAGYDIGLTPLFVLRPKIGAGIAGTSLSSEG